MLCPQPLFSFYSKPEGFLLWWVAAGREILSETVEREERKKIQKVSCPPGSMGFIRLSSNQSRGDWASGGWWGPSRREASLPVCSPAPPLITMEMVPTAWWGSRLHWTWVYSLLQREGQGPSTQNSDWKVGGRVGTVCADASLPYPAPAPKMLKDSGWCGMYLCLNPSSASSLATWLWKEHFPSRSLRLHICQRKGEKV